MEDHAWRLYRHLKGDDAPLTDAFVSALEMSAEAHAQMVAAVAPFIDTSISKTVNVPADYPYADFEQLYQQAWTLGLKGLATYRPNAVLGSVLSTQPAPLQVTGDANRRLALAAPRAPVLASLRWPGRPELPGGNPAWTYMIEHPFGRLRALRRRGRPREDERPRRAALRGLGQRRRATARPRRAGEDAVDGHARRRSGLAAAEARCARHRRRRASVRDAVPAARRAAPVPRRRRRHRGRDPLALRAARRAAARRQRGHAGDRRAVRPRRAAHRHLGHAGLGGGHRQPGQRRALHRDAEGGHAARCRRRAGHAAVRARAVGHLPARARRPGAIALARHARHRPGVDRHEAAQAAQLRRAARPLHGLRPRPAAPADLAFDGGLPRAPGDPPLRDARRARRERLAAARDGRAGVARSARQSPHCCKPAGRAPSAATPA